MSKRYDFFKKSFLEKVIFIILRFFIVSSDKKGPLVVRPINVAFFDFNFSKILGRSFSHIASFAFFCAI